MPITLRQVAAEAGVSIATVSRILTGHKAEAFPETTRRRIVDVAHRLGYRPNMAAKSLQMRRSFLIGILFNAANALLSSDFLRGVQAVLHGDRCSGEYSPIVFSHADSGEQADCLRRCLDRRVDGLIINASHDAAGGFDTPRFAALIQRGLPVIEVFGRCLPGVPRINIDNLTAGRKSVQHLLDLGHRRIGMLTHERYLLGRDAQRTHLAPRDDQHHAERDEYMRAGHVSIHWDAWDRYRGYEAAMRAAGLEPLVVTHPIAGEIDVAEQFVEGGRAALDALLAHPARPTAVVCYNDLEAYGLVRGARQRGVPLPERLSIVGFGDLDHSRVMTPALTTMPVPSFEVGRQAAQALLARIDERPVESALIEMELVMRESTAERVES